MKNNLEEEKLKIEKEKLELEKKKVELEKLRIKEQLFRTIVLIILTSGAGFGTALYKQYSLQTVNNFALITLGTTLIVFFFIAFGLWLDIRKKLKGF